MSELRSTSRLLRSPIEVTIPAVMRGVPRSESSSMPEWMQANHAAFQAELSRLLVTHAGKFALIKAGRLIRIEDDREVGLERAWSEFGPDAEFLLQPIAPKLDRDESICNIDPSCRS